LFVNVDEWFVDTHKTVREEQFLKLDAQRDEIIFPSISLQKQTPSVDNQSV